MLVSRVCFIQVLKLYLPFDVMTLGGLCPTTPGPGMKPAEERTIEYLEEVAVGVAKGIANKTVPLSKEKSVMQSK